MGLLSNRIPRESLKRGDHIYSWRHGYVYSHHGIYAGEGCVIHFTRGGGQEVGTGTILDRFIFSSSPSNHDGQPCPQCGDHSNADGVIQSCLDCFLSGGDLYLFSYGVSPPFFLAKARGGTCTLAKSDPPEDVLYRATYLLENGFGAYSLFKNNCEDFAIYCKTGLLVITNVSVGRSGQASAFLAAVSAVVSSPLRYLTTSFGGLTAVGCGIYCVSRLVSDIGVRRDMINVPVERLDAIPSRSATEEEEAMAVRSNGPLTRAHSKAIALATTSFIGRATQAMGTFQATPYTLLPTSSAQDLQDTHSAKPSQDEDQAMPSQAVPTAAPSLESSQETIMTRDPWPTTRDMLSGIDHYP